jgi:nucleotide-binding universal stress UspA family protein
MSVNTGRIVVGIDASEGSELALNWALDEALARDAAVHLICCHTRPLLLGWEGANVADLQELASAARRTASDALVSALDRARGTAPTVPVTGETVEGRPAVVLAERSAGAQLIVLGSRRLKAVGSVLLGSVGTAVTARAQCPVVVVRGPAGMLAERPAVVVGIDGTDAADPALAYGFEHASRHDVPLRAVMCWRPDPLATMQWRPEAPVPERAQAWVTATLQRWQRRYPSVTAAGIVIRDQAAAGLVEQSAAEHLLVVGSRSRNALAGTLLGSVAHGVLHHATCPVAVVPVWVG